MTATVEKAFLTIFQPTTAGGLGPPIGQIFFHFNPREYSVSRSVNWRPSPNPANEEGPTSEFTGAQPQTMDLEIFLDEDVGGRPIVPDIEMLLQATVPTTLSKMLKRPSPPFVLFGWGPTTSVRAYIKSVNVQYTRFEGRGIPTRAVVKLRLEELPLVPGLQNPTSGAREASRSHIVQAGDSLASIAYQEYQEPNRWRDIAEANDIDDPMRIPTGTRLVLPAVGSNGEQL